MKKSFYCIVLISGLFMLVPSRATAQKNNERRHRTETTAAQKAITIRTRIVDEQGAPIRHAAVAAGELVPFTCTDARGCVEFRADPGSRVVVTAEGYLPFEIVLTRNSFPAEIALIRALPDVLSACIRRADGAAVTRGNLTGAADQISGESLRSYPDLMLGNALQGRIAGLVVTPTAGKLGSTAPTFTLRGLHGKSGNQPIVLVDGSERPIDALIAEEIESVQVLKDPATKLIYGPRAANGVILITTRRGGSGRFEVRISAEAGITQLTRLPEWLGSQDYARLYNEARENDGLRAFYSPRQLEGYAKSSGVNDMLFPDVDYCREFLNRQSLFRKASVEVAGGGETVNYALILGYTGNNGYERVGQTPGFDRLNVRGNVDVRVNDYLRIAAGIASQMADSKWGSKTSGEVFTALSTHRPNEYPFVLDPEQSGIPADPEGFPLFGAGLSRADNLYADMLYGGFSKERTLDSQADLKLTIDLDKAVKGLSLQGGIAFDNYNYFLNGQRTVHATYAVTPYLDYDGDARTLITQMRKYTPQTDQSRLGERNLQTLVWNASLNYSRRFGKHDLAGALAHTYRKQDVKGKNPDVINSNTTLRLNYAYDGRLLAEASIAGMGSKRFAPGNKFFFAPAAGFAWILSEENFLRESRFVDFLKLKGSFGILGYDGSTPFAVWRTGWADGGSVKLGEQNKGAGAMVTDLLRLGNDALKWERSTEWNAGFEALFACRRLFAEINYFHEKRSEIIGYKSSDFGGYLGAFHSVANMGRVLNQGVEATLRWSDRSGRFAYQAGLNGIWSKNKLSAWTQVNYPESELIMLGRPTDALTGYEALGLFGRDIPLTGHPSQHLGRYGEGDLAYADTNGDGKIDGRDQKTIGNSFPRLTMGLEIDLRYDRWGLYLLGTAHTGMDVWTNNAYYWNRGEGKYSERAAERYHPENNPSGRYPRLTTTSGTNNFRNSTYWMEKGGFFRLKNVEASYTIDSRRSMAVCKQIRIFIRASNLFVLSSIRDLDPELIDGGVTNYPLTRTVTAGLSVKF